MNKTLNYKKSLCFLAGSLANLALAPFEIFPVLFLSFPVLLWALDNAQNKKQAFWRGWWFGFGYFIFGLYWIANSLLIEADKFWWLIPFSVAGIPFGLAFFTGAVGAAYFALSRKISNLAKIFLFSALWVMAEIARTYVPFGGFPWNLIGYSTLAITKFSQIASVGGVYLAGYFAVLFAMVPVVRKSNLSMFLIAAIAAMVLCYGQYKVNYDRYITTKGIVKIVQPNIEQKMHWDEAQKEKNFEAILEQAKITKMESLEPPKFIILPESGVPYHLNREPEKVKQIAAIAPKDGFVITGALRSEVHAPSLLEVWNTIYVINDKAEIVAHYDKYHLVPFGEYVPLRSLLPIDKITPGALDFSAGEKPSVIEQISALPLMCYEIIFPEYSRSSTRPEFILNLTNDAWFGNSTGPHQHLAAARMRAIEQGVPVIRAANTGISAIIDSKGNILQQIGLDQKAVLLEYVPYRTLDKSIYSRFNYLAVLLLMIFSGSFVIFSRKINK